VQNKHLYTLLDTTFTTIAVAFKQRASTTKPPLKMEKGELSINDAFEPAQTFIYKVRKDEGIKVDDAVVVESPQNGLMIVRVVAVHDAPQIDLDAPFEYKWIIQKIDRTAHDEQVDKERRFNDMMLEVERTRQREATLGNMREHLPEGSEARRLFDQAQTLLPSVPTYEAPPAAPATHS
jgi:hypothetical protein